MIDCKDRVIIVARKGCDKIKKIAVAGSPIDGGEMEAQ